MQKAQLTTPTELFPEQIRVRCVPTQDSAGIVTLESPPQEAHGKRLEALKVGVFGLKLFQARDAKFHHPFLDEVHRCQGGDFFERVRQVAATHPDLYQECAKLI